MQTVPQLIWLRCLKSMIDFEPLTVEPETWVLDAIALMANQGKSALVGSATQIVGCFSQQDVVRLVACGVDFKTTKISEVMHTPIITLKLSELDDLATVLSQLRQAQLDFLPLLDESDRLIGIITLSNLCQVVEQQSKETRDKYESIEEKLRLLESLLVNDKDAIVITEAGALDEPLGPKIVYANTAFTQMCGYSLGELLGKTPRFLQGEQTSRTELAKIRAVLQTGSSIQTELLNYKKNGTPYWVEMNLFPIADLEGKITYFVAIQRDITARKRDQESLKQTEELFQQLTQNIPQVLFVGDAKQHKISYVSPGYAKIGGTNSDRLLENPLEYLESIHPQDRDRIITAKENLLLGESFNEEYRIIRPDGELRWIWARTFPVKNELGETYRFVGIAEDITELKQAALRDRQLAIQALRHSQERFRNLVEASSDLVWEVDENALYTYVSPKIRDILGYEPEQVLGQSPLDFMPLFMGKMLAESFTAILARKQPFQCLENIQMHQDGHLVVLEASGVPVLDSQGKFIGYRGMSRDVTQRHQAELSLRETQKQLQAILDNSSALIYLVDTQNRFLLINSQYEKLFNATQDQILGKSIDDLWTDDLADQFVVNNRQVITNSIPIEVEEVVPQADGLHTYFSVKFPLKDTNGNIYAVCGISTDITERKLVEESLLSFRKAIESTSDGVAIIDITGKGIYFNPTFVELYEYTLEELQAPGGTAAIFQQPQDREELCTSLKQGISWHREVTMRSRSGRLLQVYLRADAIKDATGKVLGIVCTHTDITQRLLVEEGLRLRDRAIAASSNGIIIADASVPNGPILYVNSAFEWMNGYSAAEVIGQNFYLFQNDENQAQLQALNAAMQAGQDCTIILCNYRQDGGLLYTKLNISPVYDVAGTLTHYIGIQTDITERQQAQTALLVSQQRLQYLLASSPGVIYSCKVSGDFGATFVSENIKAMMGYEAREFIEDARFWVNHIHPDDVSNVLAKISQILSQGYHTYEYRFLHKDGSYRWIYDQVQAVQDEAGNLVELVGYWADITERKQLEQELIIALEKEKELNELKSRFITMTSHEFRTPLSTILSSSELLEHYRQKWTEDKQLIYLRRIQTSVHRMTEMLNDILFMGKAEAGILEYQPTSFDLVEYCRHLVAEVQLDLSNQRLISFSCQSEFIPCYMDANLLTKIISNLLINAIKYSPDDSNVNFTLTCQDGRAIFEIQDQGIGIPEADLPHLFASFHRASNVGNIIGNGLGLAIVKKCVDIHHGEIFVSTTLGVGTRFTLTLPISSHHDWVHQ